MLRLLVAAVLVANLLFLAWSQGWLAPGFAPPRHAEREPGRLAAQVRPESLVVLPPTAASAAVKAARAAAAVCLEAGPFAAAVVEAAETALAAAKLPEGALQRAQDPPPQWLVYAGRFTEAAPRRAREEELKRLGIAYEPLTDAEELSPGLVISRHPSQVAADAALQGLSGGQALKGVRVVEMPAAQVRFWLRVARADEDMAARLKAATGPELGEGFKPCAAPP